MSDATAVISMLHEDAEINSATREFRGDPVLSWTLERLSRCENLGHLAILCWEDQLERVHEIAEDASAYVLAKGPRISIPSIEAVAASRRWADGWRGGLLNTCDFDLGFHGAWCTEILDHLDSSLAALVDPSAALVDFALIDALIERAKTAAHVELCFSQAAPGLSGAVLRKSLLKNLASAQCHPGKLLHYLPDQPARDPISGEGCIPVPTPVARTTHNFKLNSARQLARVESATVSLNGQLVTSHGEDIVAKFNVHPDPVPFPREVTLELTTARHTRPIFSASGQLNLARRPLDSTLALPLFAELGSLDDVRLTLAGVGDPLLHPNWLALIDAAHAAGISAIHVETDLLNLSQDDLSALASSPIDILSVNVPALTAATYQALMSIDAIQQAHENIHTFLQARNATRRSTPLLVPLFTKCRQNLAEMEAWYDQWLRAIGAAAILGPSDFSGQISDASLADMSPPKRTACRRLSSRINILSDGTITACDQDITARMPLGNLSTTTVRDAWRSASSLRSSHANGNFNCGAICAACKEWHRP